MSFKIIKLDNNLFLNVFVLEYLKIHLSLHLFKINEYNYIIISVYNILNRLLFIVYCLLFIFC